MADGMRRWIGAARSAWNIPARVRNSPAAPVWVGNGVALTLRFVQSVVIARVAGSELFGLLTIAVVYSTILAQAVDLGVANGLAFLVRSRPASARGFVATSLIHCALAAPLLLLALAALSLLHFGDESARALFAEHAWLVAALCLAHLFNSMALAILVPLQKYLWYAFAITIVPVVTIVLVTGLALAGHVDVVQLLTASAAAEFVAGVFSCALIVLRTGPSDSSASLLRSAAELYIYSIRSFPGQLLKSVSQRADRLVLAAILPAAELGTYALAVNLREQALTPMNIHALVVRNEMIAALQVKRDAGAAGRYLRRTIGKVAMIAAAFAAPAAIASPWIIPLIYGPTFADTGTIAAILFLTLPLIAVANCGWSFVLADGSPGIFSFTFALATLIMLAGVILGALNETAIAVAVGNLTASVFIMMLWLAISFWRLRKRMP